MCPPPSDHTLPFIWVRGTTVYGPSPSLMFHSFTLSFSLTNLNYLERKYCIICTDTWEIWTMTPSTYVLLSPFMNGYITFSNLLFPHCVSSMYIFPMFILRYVISWLTLLFPRLMNVYGPHSFPFTIHIIIITQVFFSPSLLALLPVVLYTHFYFRTTL